MQLSLQSVFLFAVVWFCLFLLKCVQVLWALCIAAAVLGFAVHYVLPQLRKHQPWLCAINPVLRAKEYGAYNVTSKLTLLHVVLGVYWFSLSRQLTRSLIESCLVLLSVILYLYLMFVFAVLFCCSYRCCSCHVVWEDWTHCTLSWAGLAVPTAIC